MSWNSSSSQTCLNALVALKLSHMPPLPLLLPFQRQRLRLRPYHLQRLPIQLHGLFNVKLPGNLVGLQFRTIRLTGVTMTGGSLTTLPPLRIPGLLNHPLPKPTYTFASVPPAPSSPASLPNSKLLGLAMFVSRLETPSRTA